MSKTLEATCEAGIVKIGTTPLPDAKKLSAGIGPSSGVAILDEDKQYYLANTTPDLKSVVEDLIDLTTKLTTLIGSVNASLAGAASAPYPNFVTDALLITGPDPTSILSKLTLLKENLQ